MLNKGDKLKSNQFGIFEVIERIHSRSIIIKFDKTGFICTTTEDNAINGRVKDRLLPVIFGVGFIGDGEHGSSSPYYSIWHNMIARCYSIERQKIDITYIDCTVCDEWANFQNFAKWCELNYAKGMQIDKDILIKDNKTYSPDTCLFVTQDINKKYKNGKQRNNTSGFKGVSFDKSSQKWLARKSIGKGKRIRVGLFETAEKANKALELVKLNEPEAQQRTRGTTW